MPGTGRREHLDDATFIKELERMYALGRSEASGNVALSFSKLPQKWVKMKGSDKKGKKKGGPVSGAVEKAHAIVRAKRKGKTISCIVGEEDLLKFQANLASTLKANIDTLKKADKMSKKDKKALKKAQKSDTAKKDTEGEPAPTEQE
eukprot:TRINITY_DN10403_c0_g2_i1.p2 TRINITY_DN10403_c0_g2~~TRINITY_DN10403_c0_g2_i1.p2  ORF type:complete len:158 (+),score=41.94 TRINITY_DN10403_c0_g2_i1:35-475(+)